MSTRSTESYQPPSGIGAICYLVARAGPGGLSPLGTAFALGGRLVATALHVVGVEAENFELCFSRGEFTSYQQTSGADVVSMSAKVVEADPVHDIAVLELATGNEATVSYSLGSTDEVVPGARLTSFGYPHADTGRVVLTQHDAPVGAKILLPNQGEDVKHLVVNSLLRPGQSGGPVIDPVRNRVVALLVGAYAPGGGGMISLGGVDPAALHQTTYAVSAEYLAAMR